MALLARIVNWLGAEAPRPNDLNAEFNNIVNIINKIADGTVSIPGLSFGMANRTTTSSSTLTVSDQVVFADSTSGVVVITLPTAVGIQGRYYIVKRISSGKNLVNLATTSAQTIDGALGYSLGWLYHSVGVMSDGANWAIIF